MLGGFEVRNASGEAARLSFRSVLSLLAFLSLQKHREFSNAELQGTFWPESEGDKQAQNLRRAIADLRKVLERGLPLGSVVATRRGHVSVNALTVTTDIERFLALAQHGMSEEELTEAVGLYGGPLLSTLPDSWATSHRLEAEEQYARVVERLCTLLVEQARAKEAVSIGRAAVVAAPSREDVHVNLIRTLGAAGMSVEALKQFEELERILDETWGEVPSARARAALESAFESAQATQHNLPAQTTSFIGRENEIEETLVLLDKTRLLTLTGSGGCGKTRLSLEIAARVLKGQSDGVWFVEFAAVTDPELVPQTVAKALRVAEQPGQSVREAVLGALRAKKALLVLDNCEHLLAPCAQLAADLLRECPRLTLLASSREALRIQGETTYLVPSLSLPGMEQQQTLESISRFESVRLFAERAACVRTSFAITPKDVPALASVCRRLDGIPLAIELAAARMRNMTLEELDERLDERFAVLTGGSRTALPRHQTLRSLIDWSHDLLSVPEKELFQRLAVFAGGWTLASAEDVCAHGVVSKDAMLDLLTALCDKSLIVADADSRCTRYRMLETIRHYSRDRLLESGQAAVYRDRHLKYFLALAEEAGPELHGPSELPWINRLEAEHDNIRAAMEWSLTHDRNAEDATALAGAVWPFWGLRSHANEGYDWILRALARGDNQVSPARARALYGAARLLPQDVAGSKRLCQESLEIYENLGDRHGVAQSLIHVGYLSAVQGDYETGRVQCEEGLAMARTLGDSFAVADALNHLGGIAKYQCKFALARSLMEESLAIKKEHGNRTRIANSCNNLGLVAFAQADLAGAELFFEESLSIYQELGLLGSIARQHGLLGLVAVGQGDFKAARTLFRKSIVETRMSGGGLSYVLSLEGIAPLAASLGDIRLAAQLWGAAERVWEEVGSPKDPSDIPVYSQQVAAARAALGDDEAFDRAWQEGRGMTMEEAVELAMATELREDQADCGAPSIHLFAARAKVGE